MAEAALADPGVPLCANPDCRVGVDGRCVEGFPDKATCPQFGKSRPSSPPTSAADSDNGGAHPVVTMAPSGTLTVEEADLQLKAAESRVIAIAGPHASGKTSLIAGVYDSFQLGAVGEVAFATSKSLHAFEQLAHGTRAESRRQEAVMERTARGEVRFYHLDLADLRKFGRTVLLIGDRAGEEYIESNIDGVALLPEVVRCDVLTVLVDGEKLLNLGQRHNVRAETISTLGTFTEGEAITPGQRLAIVLTKLDVVISSQDAGVSALKFFDGIVADLREEHASDVGSIESFHIAAQPTTGGAKRGAGIQALLAYWMSAPLRYDHAPTPVAPIKTDRYFAKLKMARRGASE